MIANLTAIVCLLLAGGGVRGNNNGSPPGAGTMARTTTTVVSEMRTADLASSAGGYAYDRRRAGLLPVWYARYTDHGNGRYYDAPAPVHYVVGVGGPVVPVASSAAAAATAVPETTSSPSRVPVPALAYARREIAPYATLIRPYPRDGFINYGAGQLARYARLLGPPELAVVGAPRYTADARLGSNGTHGNINGRSDDYVGNNDGSDSAGDGDDEEENNDAEEEEEEEEKEEKEKKEEEEDEDYAIGDREEASNSTRPVDDASPDNSRPNVDESLEIGDGAERTVARNSTRGENGGEEYREQRKFDAGERERHSDSRQQEHYETETANEKGDSDVAGNHGRHEEAEKDEESNSYRRTSYRKRGQKTSGFHKVYRKDEYKKETDFYDESHEKGYFDERAAADEYHYAADGDFKRGGHRRREFDRRNNESENQRDKGRTKTRDRSYSGERGENSFHNNYEDHHGAVHKSARLTANSATPDNENSERVN